LSRPAPTRVSGINHDATNQKALPGEPERASDLLFFVALAQVWSNLSEPTSDAGSTRQASRDEVAPPPRRTRVTDALRAEVARRYTAGQPSQLIAAELRVGKATVLKILRAANVAVRPVGVRF
jgi:hypothetical protein